MQMINLIVMWVELLQYQIDREPLYHLVYSLWLVCPARVELAEENQHHHQGQTQRYLKGLTCIDGVFTRLMRG